MPEETRSAAESWKGAYARPENLALAFQELFTVVARLRANRQQVNDANSFRNVIRDSLKRAKEMARRHGYKDEESRMAEFAVVAFLDESILNSGNPIFGDWPRRPMQEELYGHHVAGEKFFQYLDQLLGQPDSQSLDDLLEVFYLCLAMGFRGRFGLSGAAELSNVMTQIEEKRNRIRPKTMVFSPEALPAADVKPRPIEDPWVKRIMYGTIGLLVVVILLFTIYKISLSSGAGELRTLTSNSQTSSQSGN
jgi:type VI secretion system protein ImpK